MTCIDLTMPLDVDTPVYPGDPEVQIKVVGELERDGFLDHRLTMGTHNGTHIDAPAHMIAGANMLSAYGPDRFIGRGVLVDARAGLSLESIKSLGIKKGDIILIRSAVSDNYQHSDYAERHPGFTEEMAQYLAKRHPSMVCVDAISPDGPPFPFHKALFKEDVLLGENLINLGQLQDKSFTVYAFPLKVTIEAAPARIVASIE